MKYREFKKQLDKYFKPDDEIYPHGSSGEQIEIPEKNRVIIKASKVLKDILN